MAEAEISLPVYVYKITHVGSGRAYIGITTQQPKKRWDGHTRDAANPSRAKGALHFALRKHGVAAFHFEVIYEAVSVREAVAIERGLIASHGTLRPNGFNLTSGGEWRAGFSRSPETRLRDKHKRPGWHHTAESRAKISAALKGKKQTLEHVENARKARALVENGHSDATKEILRALRLAQMADKEVSERMLASLRAAGPKISAAKVAHWSDPDYRARSVAGIRKSAIRQKGKPTKSHTAETRKRMAAAKRRWWAAKKEIEKQSQVAAHAPLDKPEKAA